MKAVLKYLPQALLIIVFVYAATSKLLVFHTFQLQLAKQVLISRLSFMAYALPAAELLTATMLLFPRTSAKGLFASLALLSLFSVYVLLAMSGAFGRIPCSCGGILSHLSWRTHLFFNLTCLVTCLVALYTNRNERRQPA